MLTKDGIASVHIATVSKRVAVICSHHNQGVIFRCHVHSYLHSIIKSQHLMQRLVGVSSVMRVVCWKKLYSVKISGGLSMYEKLQ